MRGAREAARDRDVADRPRALKVDKLDLPATATAAFVGFNVNANALGKAKLTGIYNKKK